MLGANPTDRLPTELVIRIFGYLERKERLEMGLVCRAWRNISLSTCFWQHLCFCGRSSKRSKEIFSNRLSIYKEHSCNNIRSIKVPLYDYEGFTNFLHQDLLQRSFQHLNSFHMIGGKHLLDNTSILVNSFLQQNRQITELRLDSVALHMNLDDILSTFVQLRSLFLSSCKYSGRENSSLKLARVNIFSHPLRTLVLDNEDTSIGPIRNVFLNDLECLNLTGSSVSFFKHFQPHDTSCTIAFPSLRRLFLQKVKFPKLDADVNFEIPALEELALNDCVNLDASFFILLSFPNVKVMTINSRQTPDEFLWRLGDAVPNLIQLKVKSTMNQLMLLEQLSKFQNLAFLEVKDVTDEFIDRLAKIVPRLQTLMVNYCQEISCASLVRFVDNCRAERKDATIQCLEMDFIKDNDMDSIEWLKRNVVHLSAKQGTYEIDKKPHFQPPSSFIGTQNA